MRISRARNQTCIGCGKRIRWWWFKLGDQAGWWHIHCMLNDELGNSRGQ